MATATAMTVAKGVAKHVLYFNAWQNDAAIDIATNLDTALFCLSTKSVNFKELLRLIKELW